MRIKLTKFLVLLIIFFNILIIYYTWRSFVTYLNENSKAPAVLISTTTKAPVKRINKLLTIVIREFDLNENDVSATVQSFLHIFPNIQIYIVGNGLPYPSLEIFYTNLTKNVKIVNVLPDLRKPKVFNYPFNEIRTKYVLFVPDSSRIVNKQPIQHMLNDIYKGSHRIVASPLANKQNALCLNVHVNQQKWTLNLTKSTNSTNICEAVFGRHALLLERGILNEIYNPLMLPFPQSLYLQTASLHYKVYLRNSSEFLEGKPLFRSHHSKWKKRQASAAAVKKLYNHFSIKKVIGHNGTTEWYGCSRDTPRCFNTVLDSMPSYLFQGKWTPPCCLENLRKTAQHVFAILKDSGIRFWLESGSLLGAMRKGDILPWDYDVDIGVNRDDIKRCQWLVRARTKATVDNKGYLWEKATEGNFYRVHFSRVNKIFVNLFPFYSKNGTMTRDSWFTSHKNMEFPDRFLHPMSSIHFVGVQVPAPNNIRDFLEFKYGKGAIENPQYSNPLKLKFP